MEKNVKYDNYIDYVLIKGLMSLTYDDEAILEILKKTW